MDWKLLIAFAGWTLAIVQFLFTYQQTKQKYESELLEKTLSYLEKGTQGRSIALSLVEGIWLKKKKNLEVILPVLIAQSHFLLVEADDYAQESRNLIRLFYLIEKCLPHAIDPHYEKAEISEAILTGLQSEKGIKLSNQTLKKWFSCFNDGDSEIFEAETEYNKNTVT